MEILTNPLTYIVGLVVIFSVLEYRKQKSCSSKSCEANKTSTPSKPKRARTSKGKFVADDPKTPQNEAWKGGKAPKKKATKKTPTKKAVKKRTPKKSGTKN